MHNVAFWVICIVVVCERTTEGYPLTDYHTMFSVWFSRTVTMPYLHKLYTINLLEPYVRVGQVVGTSVWSPPDGCS